MIYNFTDPAPVYFGDIPKKYTAEFEAIIDRAVKLVDIEPEQTPLLQEKKSELEMMIISLCPEYYDPEYVLPENERSEFPISHAKILYQNLNSLTLDANDEFTWAQYFGLLALMEIHQDIFMFSFEEHIPEDMKIYIGSTHRRYLVNALEAVCFGETLGPELPTQSIVKDKLSKQAQKAISIRYKPLNEIKQKFIEFYLKSDNKNNKTEIARKFYRQLPDEQQKILTSTLKVENACRTLINHLNKLIHSEPFNRYR